MTLLTPNTSEMEDLTPIEPGTFAATIVKAEADKSKAGNQMIVPTFEVAVGDGTRTRKSYLAIEGRGTWGFDQLLRACDMDELADQYKDPTVENPPFDTDVLIGQSVMLVIDTQEYQGQPRDTITTYLKP